ncbi:MAG: DNA polymerase III subunit delta [Hydrogenophaga sp.]|uniref:DNA polymerase III subunit delta n=1 Tax=Hydrogenophaga sp. TaxID=1904254 RepID=UPI002ABC58BF|nr:DNA polymerase III subunit delta [Hydrogenophaga sp.]MDZ4176403.1 DNA polymerase III subunit delta [Hydrogenophaga sp.]
MQLRPEQLAPHLDKPLAPLYLVHGDEPLLVIEAADAIRATARKQGFTEREVLVAGTGFRWDDLFLAAGNLSLFGESKVIDLRIPSGKPGREGSEALQRYIKTLGPGMVTLITLPELDWQVKKSTWVTTLATAGVAIECNAPPLARLPQWLAERLARQQQSAPRAALDFIAAHVEGNLLAAHQEIQKLGLLHPAGELSLEQVENAVLNVARYTPFKLAEAVLGGQVLRVQRMLDGLQAEGEAAVLVHWALAEDIRTLNRVRGAMDAGRPLPMALRENRVWGVKEKLMERVLPLLKPATLAQWLQDAHTVDGIVKGLKQSDWPADPWGALNRMALRVAQACALK